MKTVLILGERDSSGAVQNATLELLALAQARTIPADVVMEDGDRPRLLQDAVGARRVRVWFLTGDVSRYSARKLARAIEAICQKIGADSLWGSSSLRSRDLLVLLRRSGRWRRHRCRARPRAGADGMGRDVRGVRGARGAPGSAVGTLHEPRVRLDGGGRRRPRGRGRRRRRDLRRQAEVTCASSDDLVVPEREEGVQLKDADVVLDVGAGVGAKGVPRPRSS